MTLLRMGLLKTGILLALLLYTPFVWAEAGCVAREYPATVVRVIDGDTIDVVAKLGLRVEYRTPVRFPDYDAPELKKTEGIAARKYLVELIGIDGRQIVLITCITHEFDKYGRVLAGARRGSTDFVAEMIKAGHIKKGATP